MLLFIPLALATALPLEVRPCHRQLVLHQLRLINGDPTTNITESTQLSLCTNEETLIIDFFNHDLRIDNPIKDYYLPHFSRHDLNVVLIGEPQEYYQYQVSPQGVLSFAKIENRNQDCEKISVLFLESSKVKFTAEKLTPVTWASRIEIPLAKKEGLRANFFRVNRSGEKLEFTALNPTLNECFHYPQKFVELAFFD